MILERFAVDDIGRDLLDENRSQHLQSLRKAPMVTPIKLQRACDLPTISTCLQECSLLRQPRIAGHEQLREKVVTKIQPWQGMSQSSLEPLLCCIVEARADSVHLRVNTRQNVLINYPATIQFF